MVSAEEFPVVFAFYFLTLWFLLPHPHVLQIPKNEKHKRESEEDNQKKEIKTKNRTAARTKSHN